MGKVNPIILIQMLLQYHHYTSGRRVFKFTRNNRMRVHRESPEENKSRKSVLSDSVRTLAETKMKAILLDSLKGRAGKVYVDPRMKKIAVPLQMSASQSGFNVLPTGSRVKIPEGQKIRAFTYWEKVDDIDLSCFGLTEDGSMQEFSWRSMWKHQSTGITFSGDETSGYHGGSEYFDISLEEFKRAHPGYRYVVFCDNVFSNTTFNSCFCKAGFMIRDELDSGEVFEPKTVGTTFMVNGDGSFNYLFAIDLKTREMVWLNLIRSDRRAVAGEENMDFILFYLDATEVFNVYDLFAAAGEMCRDVLDADIIISDADIDPAVLGERAQIHSYDFEKLLKFLQPQ